MSSKKEKYIYIEIGSIYLLRFQANIRRNKTITRSNKNST